MNIYLRSITLLFCLTTVGSSFAQTVAERAINQALRPQDLLTDLIRSVTPLNYEGDISQLGNVEQDIRNRLCSAAAFKLEQAFNVNRALVIFAPASCNSEPSFACEVTTSCVDNGDDTTLTVTFTGNRGDCNGPFGLFSLTGTLEFTWSVSYEQASDQLEINVAIATPQPLTVSFDGILDQAIELEIQQVSLAASWQTIIPVKATDADPETGVSSKISAQMVTNVGTADEGTLDISLQLTTDEGACWVLAGSSTYSVPGEPVIENEYNYTKCPDGCLPQAGYASIRSSDGNNFTASFAGGEATVFNSDGQSVENIVLDCLNNLPGSGEGSQSSLGDRVILNSIYGNWTCTGTNGYLGVYQTVTGTNLLFDGRDSVAVGCTGTMPQVMADGSVFIRGCRDLKNVSYTWYYSGYPLTGTVRQPLGEPSDKLWYEFPLLCNRCKGQTLP